MLQRAGAGELGRSAHWILADLILGRGRAVGHPWNVAREEAEEVGSRDRAEGQRILIRSPSLAFREINGRCYSETKNAAAAGRDRIDPVLVGAPGRRGGRFSVGCHGDELEACRGTRGCLRGAEETMGTRTMFPQPRWHGPIVTGFFKPVSIGRMAMQVSDGLHTAAGRLAAPGVSPQTA